MIEMSRSIGPDFLIEIEADAFIDEPATGTAGAWMCRSGGPQRPVS
tara:strand:+ start:301 stop:438 length:138 start_codon:yes stop_codon:yes gene_type:complete